MTFVGQDIPPTLRPGDREDVIGQILEARTPAGALLARDAGEVAEPLERLARYRRVVNQIHPDRCVDGRAAAAFERACRAFDQLCAQDWPSEELDAGKSWHTSHDAPSPQGCWWQVGTVTDLNCALEYRTVATQVLLEELIPSIQLNGLQRLRACVVDTERVCEHLDRGLNLSRHRLWPHSRKRRALEETGVLVQARQQAARFVDILCYLRIVHRYCHLHGRKCDHQAELAAVSSPSEAKALIKRLLTVGDLTNGTVPLADETSIKQAQLGDSDADPLDVYMELVEAELEGLHACDDEPSVKRAHDGTTNHIVTEAAAAAAGTAAGAGVVPPVCAAPQVAAASLAQASAKDVLNNAVPQVRVPNASVASDATMCQPSGAPAPVPSVGGHGGRSGGGQQWPANCMRMATGGLLELKSMEAAGGKRGAEQVVERGLQDQLLGDLESEGSELEDEEMSC